MPLQPGSGVESDQLVYKDRVQALYRLRVESVASGLVVGAMLAVALLRVHIWQVVLLGTWASASCSLAVAAC